MSHLATYSMRDGDIFCSYVEWKRMQVRFLNLIIHSEDQATVASLDILVEEVRAAEDYLGSEEFSKKIVRPSEQLIAHLATLGRQLI